MEKQTRITTAAELIEHLKKVPSSSPVYFDCPYCGRANGFHKLSIGVLLQTEKVTS